MPSERIFVSPPVVRPTSFTQPSPVRGSTQAVYLGNLAHREIDHLLDSSSAVVAQMPEFKLTIYGDSSADARETLAQTVEDRGLAGVVALEPPVSPTAVPEVLGRADLLLLPRSSGEFSAAGFPNKLGEYLASGRPVVVTRVGDIPKYLTDGESAFLVEPDDNAAFAEAVVRVMSSPELVGAVGAEGRRVAENNMRADVVAERLAAWMTSLRVAERTRSAPGTAKSLWSRFGELRPDPELTRRDISIMIRPFRHWRG
jgi:glycosyltransferase involved in cell wall biosynthesis